MNLKYKIICLFTKKCFLVTSENTVGLGKDRRDSDLSIWVLVYKMKNIHAMNFTDLFFSSTYTKPLTNTVPVLCD